MKILSDQHIPQGVLRKEPTPTDMPRTPLPQTDRLNYPIGEMAKSELRLSSSLRICLHG